MKIVITGGAGMLARTLARSWSDNDVIAPARDRLDVTVLSQVQAVLRELSPQVVVHCAAHTKVDLCETESERAYAINAVGSANVAIACQRLGIRLIAISTDYVFGGDLDRPYHEWDGVGPRTVYGASKLAGEEAVRRHCPDHVIARVAWLYGAGGPSFVHTMLRLGRSAAVDGRPLRVVEDQCGNPTSAHAVAAALRPLLQPQGPVGTFHTTCQGETTWYGFAREVFRLCDVPAAIEPCTTDAFPRPAPRPRNSRLDGLARRLHGLPALPPWQEALAEFLAAGDAP